MRKIVWMMSVSLDGFMEGPEHDLTWQRVDEELHTHFNDWLATASAFLDGRATWELMTEHWPAADANPKASKVTADFAKIWRDMPKIMYSRTREEPAGWNTTIVREVVPDEVRALQAQPGGDLVLSGANLARTFLRNDLIDEYRIYVQPVILGRGTPMFQVADVRRILRLAETRTFTSGVVLLRYQR
jgi:dihydrofolate reductase